MMEGSPRIRGEIAAAPLAIGEFTMAAGAPYARPEQSESLGAQGSPARRSATSSFAS